MESLPPVSMKVEESEERGRAFPHLELVPAPGPSVTSVEVLGVGEGDQWSDKATAMPYLMEVQGTSPPGEHIGIGIVGRKTDVDEDAARIVCCNCTGAMPIGQGSKKLSELIHCSIFDVEHKRVEKKDVKIVEIMASLYTLRNHSLPGDLQMCENCVKALEQLYQLYNEFLSISVMSESALSKLISARTSSEKTPHSRKPKMASSALRRRSSRAPPASTSFSSTSRQTKLDVNYKPDIVISRQSSRTSHNSLVQETKVNCSSGRSMSAAVKLEPKNEGVPKPMILRSEKVSLPQLMLKPGSKNVCTRCGKSYKSFVGLKVHFASHLRDDNKFECKECGKKFRKQDALDLHAKTEHEGFKPHKCHYEGCNRSFRLKDKLKLHIQVIHEKRKPFPCTKCEKSFRTKYHLKVHDVAQHIQGDDSIGCSQCKRKFPTRELLTAHMKTHEEDKPFACSVCQKGFHTVSRLKLHKKSHDDIPSCICSVCGKAYKHVRDLRLHEVVHQDESTYRFACGDCPKKFYRIDLLRVHQSNEQHFSPEAVGPSMSKLELPKSANKSKSKGTKRKNMNDDGDEEVQIFDELESKQVDKPGVLINRGRTKQIPKTKKGKQLSHSPASSERGFKMSSFKTAANLVYQPNLASIADDAPHFSRLKSAQFGASQSERNEEGIHETSDNKLESITAVNSQESEHEISRLTPGLPFHSSTGQGAPLPVKDANEQALSSFCISAGAEQIGFDVISAFINNLN